VFAYLSGRSGRAEFWIGIAMLLVVGIGLTLFQVAGASAVTTFLWIILWARRLHDLGRSGWTMLIPIGLMFLVSAGAFALGGNEIIQAMRAAEANSTEISERGARLLLAFAGVVAVIQGGFTIWLGSKAGEPNSNRFGPPPGKLFG
jgi:uncharacterized membrane protein YhaH (DUF805 family)